MQVVELQWRLEMIIGWETFNHAKSEKKYVIVFRVTTYKKEQMFLFKSQLSGAKGFKKPTMACIVFCRHCCLNCWLCWASAGRQTAITNFPVLLQHMHTPLLSLTLPLPGCRTSSPVSQSPMSQCAMWPSNYLLFFTMHATEVGHWEGLMLGCAP